VTIFYCFAILRYIGIATIEERMKEGHKKSIFLSEKVYWGSQPRDT